MAVAINAVAEWLTRLVNKSQLALLVRYGSVLEQVLGILNDSQPYRSASIGTAY